MDTNVFALDLNHLLIRNFRNKLDLLQLDSTWEAETVCFEEDDDSALLDCDCLDTVADSILAER